jgi:hypothetical protein
MRSNRSSRRRLASPRLHLDAGSPSCPSAIPGVDGAFMEPSVRNRWRTGRARKPLKQADPQPAATHDNGFAAHGKEGVDGSSPSEGSAKAPFVGASRRPTCWFSRVGGMEPFMEAFAFKTAYAGPRECDSAAERARRRTSPGGTPTRRARGGGRCRTARAGASGRCSRCASRRRRR